jgi:hypothetical protein
MNVNGSNHVQQKIAVLNYITLDSCHHGMVSPWTKGGPSAWGLGEGLTTPHHKKPACYEMLHRVLELKAQHRDQWWALVNMVVKLRVAYNVGDGGFHDLLNDFQLLKMDPAP